MQKKVYQNGDIFYGQLKDGHKNGIGIFIRKDTLVYIGYWKNSNPIGKGLLVDKELIIFQDTQSNLYFEQSVTNEFVNCFYKRKPHKQLEGIFKFDDKIIKGNIICSKRPLLCTQFSGFFEMRNNHKIYKGFFKNNLLKKVGQLSSSQGLFIGNFTNNKKNGYGIQELFSIRQNIIRKYIEDEPQNNCILVCKEMFCIQILEQGIQSGLICYQDGSIYFGQIIQKRDSNLFLRHGFGYLYEENNYFLGEWNFDQKQGLGYEVKFNYTGDQSRIEQNSQQQESEVLSFLKQYSQTYKQCYSQFVSLEKFFKNKNRDYVIDTEFIGQWNKGLKNGEGIFESQVTQVDGIWRNGQLIKKSQQKNFEYLNQFEKKDFYQQGQIYVLKLLSKVSLFKKECYQELEITIKQYKKNYKFLNNLSYNENDLIANKQLLQKELDELAFKISKKCDDLKIKKILLDPFNYIQIKQQDSNTQTLYDKLMTSLVEKQKGQKDQKQFLTSIKRDTQTQNNIFKKLNSFYQNLQASNTPRVTFQQNNMLNELYNDMSVKSNNRQPNSRQYFEDIQTEPNQDIQIHQQSKPKGLTTSAEKEFRNFVPNHKLNKKISESAEKEFRNFVPNHKATIKIKTNESAEKEFKNSIPSHKTLLKKQTTEKMSEVKVESPEQEAPNSFQIIANESQVKKLDRVEFKTFEVDEMTPPNGGKNQKDKPFDPFSSGSDNEKSESQKQDDQQQEQEKPFDPFSSGSDVEQSESQQNQQIQDEQQEDENKHPFLSDDEDEEIPVKENDNIEDDYEEDNGLLSKDSQEEINNKKSNLNESNKKDDNVKNLNFEEANNQFLSQESAPQLEDNQQTQNFNFQELDNNFLSDEGAKEEQAQIDNMTTQEHHNFFNITQRNSKLANDKTIKISSTKKDLDIIAVDSAEDIEEDEPSQKNNLQIVAVDSMQDFEETIPNNELDIKPVDSEILDEPEMDQTVDKNSVQRKSTNQGIISKQVDSQIHEDLDNINSEDSNQRIDISVEEEKQRIKEENEKTLIKNQTMIDEYLPKFSSLNHSQNLQANLKKQSDSEPDYLNDFSSLDEQNI